MIKPALIEAPTVQPVSLAEVKDHLRIEHDDDDAIINALIAAATTHLDGYGGILGRCIMQQKWKVSADRFCSRRIDLPFENNSAVVVKYFDNAAQEQTVAATDYEVLTDTLGSYVLMSVAFPHVDLANTHDPAWVEIVSGAQTTVEVPENLKLGIKMLIATWYEHRDGGNAGPGLPVGVEQVLAPFRRMRL